MHLQVCNTKNVKHEFLMLSMSNSKEQWVAIKEMIPNSVDGDGTRSNCTFLTLAMRRRLYLKLQPVDILI